MQLITAINVVFVAVDMVEAKDVVEAAGGVKGLHHITTTSEVEMMLSMKVQKLYKINLIKGKMIFAINVV